MPTQPAALPQTVYTGAAGLAYIASQTYALGGNDGGGYPLYIAPYVQGSPSNYIRWDTGRAAWIFTGSSASSQAGPNDPNAVYVSSGGQTLASGPVGPFAVASSTATPVAAGSSGASGSSDPSQTQTNGASPAPVVSLNPPAAGTVLSDTLLGDACSGGGVTHPARTLSNNLLLDGLSPGPVGHGAWALTDTLLTDSFLGAAVTHAPHTLPDMLLLDSGLTGGTVQSAAPVVATGFFMDRLLADVLSGGGVTHAPALFSEVLLTDSVSPQPQTLPAAFFSDALVWDALTSQPRAFAPVVLKDSLLTDTGGRTGSASAPGGTSAAFMFSDRLLLDGGVSGGAVSHVPRSLSDTLLEEALSRTAFSRTRAFGDTLLTDRLIAFPVQPEPLPGHADERDPFLVLAAELRRLALMKGSSMTLVSTTLAVTDKIAAAYRISEISQAANTLAGLTTLIRGGDGQSDKTYGFGQDAPILALLPAAEGLIAGSAPNVILSAQYRGFLSALAGYASTMGFPSFDAYLSSLNMPVPYQALVHPNFALLNWLFNAQRGTLLMSPGNVFAPQTTFGTAAAGAAAGSILFSHLSDIPAANIVSSVAGQSTQGYTAAPGAAASLTAAVNGTLTATLTAFGQNAAGQPVSGRVWTAALDNAAAGSLVNFVPANAGDRIYGISSLSGVGTATAGAFVLGSVLERVVS